MTWVRTEDSMPLHPKILRLSDGAFRLWANGLAFANRATTDGRIDAELVATLNHHGKWSAKLMKTLITELISAGLWVDCGGYYQIHDYEHHQAEAMKERVERKRAYERDKKRKQRDEADRNGAGFPMGVPGRVPTGQPTGLPPGARGVSSVPTRPVPSRVPSEQEDHGEPAKADPPRVESCSEEIRTLEARYPTGLCDETRNACALSRRNGKLSDSVWLKLLRQLAPHPADRVADGMRTFVERYADGEKDERYLVGIVRSGKRRAANGNGAARDAMRPPSPASEFQPDGDSDEYIASLFAVKGAAHA